MTRELAGLFGRIEAHKPDPASGARSGVLRTANGDGDELGESEAWRIWRTRLNIRNWRTPVFFEIVSSEISARSSARRPTVLDIGCGRGFDGEAHFHAALAAQAGRFVGIEPDLAIEPPKIFSEVFRTTLENAPLARGSVDVAYAIMVMEHVADPAAFWSRLHDILAPGGVFVGFTVNWRHWYAPASRFLSAIKLKTMLLNLFHGKRGTERVADYPVYYRTNTLEQIKRFAEDFRTVETRTFGAVGDVAFWAPQPLRPIVRIVDKLAYKLRHQRINIVVRAVR